MPFFGIPLALGSGLAAFGTRSIPWYMRAAGTLRSNIPQYAGGAMMGLGYTSGAYTGSVSYTHLTLPTILRV